MSSEKKEQDVQGINRRDLLMAGAVGAAGIAAAGVGMNAAWAQPKAPDPKILWTNAKKGGKRCYAFAGENTYHAIFGGGHCFIVHPSDSAPMLMALDAAVRIAGPDGTRPVSLEDFFVLPKEA